MASKGVNDSDPSYEFSDHFMQKVNFGNSSVHIPVEIYNGGEQLGTIKFKFSFT